VRRLRVVQGDVLLFASRQFMRVLATRWIELEGTVNTWRCMLSTANLSALGSENELARPVIRLENATKHMST
jgi:hypothetical protein